MEAATDAFNEGASDGMPTLNSQAPTTSSGRPDPSAPMHTTSGPAGNDLRRLPRIRHRRHRQRNRRSLAASRNVDRLDLPRDRRVKDGPHRRPDRLGVVQVRGSLWRARPPRRRRGRSGWPCRRCPGPGPRAATLCAAPVTVALGRLRPEKRKTPTGPAGVLSVETRRICASSSKTCSGAVVSLLQKRGTLGQEQAFRLAVLLGLELRRPLRGDRRGTRHSAATRLPLRPRPRPRR